MGHRAKAAGAGNVKLSYTPRHHFPKGGSTWRGINSNKVVVGGLLAGVIIFVGDFLMTSTLVASDMQAMATARNLDLAALESAGSLVQWIIVDLLFGLVAVWTYAAIRPRFGPGPKTAAIAGTLIWLTVTLSVYSFVVMGMFPMALFVKTSIVMIVVMNLATIVGAWPYAEA